MTVIQTRTIEFDKVTSTNMCYFQTNDKLSFETIINFLATVNTFHLKKANELLLNMDDDMQAKMEIEKDNRMLQKFEIEVVHRYLNTLLLDGEYNAEVNVKLLLDFYDQLAKGDRELIKRIDEFAKQMPIKTDTFSAIVLDESSYYKIMDLFTGDNYLSHLGFNQAIILSSKLLSRLRSLLGVEPSPVNLFMFYLGTRFG